MALQPKHFWMSFPVMLLLMSLSIGVTAFVASSKGHDREHERDYYARGLEWDKLQEQVAASVNLGWQVEFQSEGLTAYGESIDVTFVFTDGDGQLVTGATGRVRAIFNADANTIFEGALTEAEPGSYVFTLAPHQVGIWRWQVHLERGDTLFVEELRAQLFGAAPAAGGAGG